MTGRPVQHSVYRYGQKVMIGPDTGRFEATVLACEFRGPDYAKLIYLLSWWDGRDHKAAWFDAVEVEAADESDARFVFKAEGSDA
jgi:hypothetical protein